MSIQMSLPCCHPSESVELFQKSFCGITKVIQSDHHHRLLCKLLKLLKMGTAAEDCYIFVPLDNTAGISPFQTGVTQIKSFINFSFWCYSTCAITVFNAAYTKHIPKQK